MFVGERVRVLGAALGALLVLLLWAAPAGATGATRDDERIVQASAEPARERVTVWVVPWANEVTIDTLRARRDAIGTISPFWYELGSDGRSVRAQWGAPNKEILEIADEAGMTVLPTVANDWNRARVSKMLATPTSRLRHARLLAAVAGLPAFDGIDVDYENIDPAERAKYTAFVRTLASLVHQRGKLLTVTVPAVSSAPWSQKNAYDLAAIGSVADQVRVMAYDYSWACGGAGPIAPATWVDDVAGYVASKVAPEKVLLGIGLYGYDWPTSGCATARTHSDVRSIMRRRGVRPVWSAAHRTNVLTYTSGRQRRVIWFEDSRSTEAKAQIANDHGLAGVALWRMGGEVARRPVRGTDMRMRGLEPPREQLPLRPERSASTNSATSASDLGVSYTSWSRSSRSISSPPRYSSPWRWSWACGGLHGRGRSPRPVPAANHGSSVMCCSRRTRSW